MEPVATILVCLITIYFTSEILQRIGIPRVVSQITTGIILGLPIFTNIFSTDATSVITFLAEIGAILLVFFIGLELNLTKYTNKIGTLATISLYNTIIPLALGFTASYLAGLTFEVSLIIGICMSVSATAFAVDILEETGKLKTALGSLIVGSGAFDDIVEIILVTGALTFIGTISTGFTLTTLALNIIIFIAAIMLFRAIIIPFILSIVEHKMYKPALFTGALIITLLLAVLAEKLHIGAVMGALFAGIIVRQVFIKDPTTHKPWEKAEISHTIHTIAFGFLVPFFFFHIGYSIDILSIWNNIGFSTLITTIAIIGTVVGSALGYWIKEKNWNNAWIVGWAMNGKGDTALVITELAFTAGVITKDIFSTLIFMAIISTLISPFAFKYLVEKDTRYNNQN